jgi:hypothetical protein
MCPQCSLYIQVGIFLIDAVVKSGSIFYRQLRGVIKKHLLMF